LEENAGIEMLARPYIFAWSWDFATSEQGCWPESHERLEVAKGDVERIALSSNTDTNFGENMGWLLLIGVATAAAGSAPPLPALSIDPDAISISGISSGADFVSYTVPFLPSDDLIDHSL
jgi:hypothetical protein